MADERKLTAKQKAFVREYLLCLNASEAARKAGYGDRNSDKIGHQLLGNTRVSQAIQEYQKKAEVKFEISQEKIIQELAAIAFGNLGQVANWDEESMEAIPKNEISEAGLKYIDGIEKITIGENCEKVVVKTLGSQKVKALHLLGKHVGLWKVEKDDGAGNDSNNRKAILGRVSDLLRKRKK